MAEYYYFASTLPMLVMGKEAPISYEKFLEDAKSHLTKKDYHDISSLSLDDVSSIPSSSFSREWRSFHDKIESLLLKERASRLGFEGYESDAIDDKPLIEKIHTIVSDMDPLEAERAILAMYFDFLSSHEGNSPFTSQAMMIYALKLQLTERSFSFSEEKGRAEFDKLYKAIETDIFR